MIIFYDEKMLAPVTDNSTPSHVKPWKLREEILKSQISVGWGEVIPATWDELSLVHDPDYIQDVCSGLRADLYQQASVVWSKQLVESLRWGAGSMVCAAVKSIESGVAISLSNGFHHAHFDSPGVYCMVNGLVLAALKVIEAGVKQPVLILDCDYHYGNGTDHILGRYVLDDNIDIKNLSLGKYFTKPDQADDYLAKIDSMADRIRHGEFGLVIYQAGMDVLLGAPMGGGILDYEQTYDRDKKVFEACKTANVPIAWNLAGGYKLDEEGTNMPVITGHMNTLKACAEFYS